MSRALGRFPIEVRWSDLDSFGHANNARFATWIEEARLRWFESLPGPWVGEHFAPLLAALQINFRRPVGWPATLAVELSAERVGTSSLTLGHRVVDADGEGPAYADGHSVMVWVDRASGKPSTLPPAVRQAASD